MNRSGEIACEDSVVRGRPKAIAGAVVGIVAAVVLVISLSDEPQGQTYVIESSHTFDVTNPRYVAGYADAVVLGTVVDVVETLVGQLGYIDGGDREAVAKQQYPPGLPPKLEP